MDAPQDLDAQAHSGYTRVIAEDGSVSFEVIERATPLPDHEVILQQHWPEVRRRRDALLAASDWVVARSFERGEPVPPEWAAYRQALRDIPASNRNPFLLVWPTPPA